ncbi:hypothetical protein OG393_21165 [Streptomyces sp. NBC_01216]|uniref:hypothetical protein n=1 Tax=Streptomyces sp. NBC_01216 TaxID=2903778 RepID=UPI002E11FD4D|nr:hypothetical protein OG393_21165 [Streptomyces sp. NBC_01216]
MSEIPTTPCKDPADTIMAAIAHGMTGNRETGLKLLEPFILGGPVKTVSMCAALASMIALNADRQNPGHRGTFGFVPIHHGVPTDTSAMPPGWRFAAQFSTAVLNGQHQTAYALFDALVSKERDEDAMNLALGIRALYDMAVGSAQQLRGGTR